MHTVQYDKCKWPNAADLWIWCIDSLTKGIHWRRAVKILRHLLLTIMTEAWRRPRFSSCNALTLSLYVSSSTLSTRFCCCKDSMRLCNCSRVTGDGGIMLGPPPPSMELESLSLALSAMPSTRSLAVLNTFDYYFKTPYYWRRYDVYVTTEDINECNTSKLDTFTAKYVKTFAENRRGHKKAIWILLSW